MDRTKVINDYRACDAIIDTTSARESQLTVLAYPYIEQAFSLIKNAAEDGLGCLQLPPHPDDDVRLLAAASKYLACCGYKTEINDDGIFVRWMNDA
ncbi:hypothetical protein [Aeromonas veronii]|uniref:hypothetical protein n=1 Tax=Aeromonas veronii TaxID=654 RepID=UPI0013026D7A|nr:hypothetical protein [Aeromonas veronii]KAE9635731.1 hypothetical protein GO977_07515 [Aeromonas veronii]